MKIGFLVEQCMHALFECPDDVNERTNYLTKAVSGEFCVISLFLQKKDFRGYVTFPELISEISLYFQINSQCILVYLCSTLRNGKTDVHRVHLLPKI